MDLTALRVERIRQDLDGTRFAMDLLARIHTTMLAVSFTVGASAVVAATASQVDPALAGPIAAAAFVTFGLQVKALRQLARQWTVARQKAAEATGILMTSQGEDPHDG